MVPNPIKCHFKLLWNVFFERIDHYERQKSIAVIISDFLPIIIK